MIFPEIGKPEQHSTVHIWLNAGVFSLQPLRHICQLSRLSCRMMGHSWDNKKFLLNTITRSIKVKNDRVCNRLPIQIGLLEILLSRIEIKFKHQYYLEIMYKTLFVLAYYGLFRIGELTKSEHAIKACNVHKSCDNSRIVKYMLSSKTHTRSDRPKKSKLTQLTSLDTAVNVFTVQLNSPWNISI